MVIRRVQPIMPSSDNYKRNYKREREVALRSSASNRAANASRKKDSREKGCC